MILEGRMNPKLIMLNNPTHKGEVEPGVGIPGLKAKPFPERKLSAKRKWIQLSSNGTPDMPPVAFHSRPRNIKVTNTPKPINAR